MFRLFLADEEYDMMVNKSLFREKGAASELWPSEKERVMFKQLRVLADSLDDSLKMLKGFLPNPMGKTFSTSRNPSHEVKKILGVIGDLTSEFNKMIPAFNQYCESCSADPYRLESMIVSIRKRSLDAQYFIAELKDITTELAKKNMTLHGFDFETLNNTLEPIVKMASSMSMYNEEPEEKPSYSPRPY